jgi:hypothetical protein
MPTTDAAPYLESFDRITTQIVGIDTQLALIRTAYLTDPSIVDDPRRHHKWYDGNLGRCDWHWPWLEEWAERFNALGAVPRMWMAKQNPHRKAFLLCHTITFSRRKPINPQFNLCYFWPVDDEPPLIQELVRKKIETYASGEGEIAFPPFWPGDRTGCRQTIVMRHGMQDESRLCRFRGYGDSG